MPGYVWRTGDLSAEQLRCYRVQRHDKTDSMNCRQQSHNFDIGTSINDVTQFWGKIDPLPLSHLVTNLGPPLPKLRHKLTIPSPLQKGSDYCLQKHV